MADDTTASSSVDDELLTALLRQSQLDHLSSTLSRETFASLGALERAPLMSHLKTLGLALGDRQKLATVVAKAKRAGTESLQASARDWQEESRMARQKLDSIPAQDFSIYCHRTTLADGSSLSNQDPAPEFIIAALEARTHKQRPPDAATATLERINLWFMSGGSD